MSFTLGSFLLGFFFSLIPFFVAYSKGRWKIGALGILVSSLAGAFLGYFAALMANAAFAWWITRDDPPFPRPPRGNKVDHHAIYIDEMGGMGQFKP